MKIGMNKYIVVLVALMVILLPGQASLWGHTLPDGSSCGGTHAPKTQNPELKEDHAGHASGHAHAAGESCGALPLSSTPVTLTQPANLAALLLLTSTRVMPTPPANLAAAPLPLTNTRVTLTPPANLAALLPLTSTQVTTTPAMITRATTTVLRLMLG